MYTILYTLPLYTISYTIFEVFEENLKLERIKYVYDFVYDITQIGEKYYKKGKNRQKMYTFSYTLQSYTISYTLKILLNQ